MRWGEHGVKPLLQSKQGCQSKNVIFTNNLQTLLRSKLFTMVGVKPLNLNPAFIKDLAEGLHCANRMSVKAFGGQ